jgi:hypothetical protein
MVANDIAFLVGLRTYAGAYSNLALKDWVTNNFAAKEHTHS